MHILSFRLGLRSAALVMLTALSLASLAACGGTAGAGSSSQPKHLTLGLTYIPNVQFAPFYVADSLGYYKDAGLDVTFHHHTFTEGEFDAIVSGKEDAIFAGGDEMLQARSKGQPFVYIANVFAKYPVALIVPADSPIHTVADLKGHTVGVPGAYGATYIGLLALMGSAGLSKSDVTIQSIGFTQVPALLGHKVDAVMGYINNEPIQFQKAGFAIRTFPVGDVQPLISNGLGALEGKLTANATAMKALVAATLRGVQYTIAHPQDAVNISKKYVPDLNDPQKAADALTVLQATNPLFESARPGYNDPAAWQSMATFLQAQGQLSGAVDVSKAFSNAYLPSQS
jgi:NitT/TauT family transport system substrate-binding protein